MGIVDTDFRQIEHRVLALALAPPASEGGRVMDIEDLKHMDNRVTAAYNEFMTRLFGSVPADMGDVTVDRDKYGKEMHYIQNKYGLEQGDPDFLEWVLTLVGRSPVLTSEGAIVYGEQAGNTEGKSVGEAPPSETE